MANHNICNGVDVTQMQDTIKAVQQKPEIATFRFRAKNRWLDGGHNRTFINDYDGAGETHKRDEAFIMDKDEPPVLLGHDKGANPVEYLLSALAGCLTTSLIFHAAARGYDIEEVTSHFEGQLDVRGFLGLDEKIRNGYQDIKVSFAIKGDIPDNIKQELLTIAQQRSPVFDMLTNGVPIMVTLSEE